MSRTTQGVFANDSWQTPRNARTLRAFMALRQAEIGQRIAQLRRDRGNPPQEAVAQALGVSYRAYQAWEAGDAKPSYRNLTKIADYYGVSEEYILAGQVDPTAPRAVTQLDRIEATLKQLDERQEALIQSVAGVAEMVEELATARRPAAQRQRRAS